MILNIIFNLTKFLCGSIALILVSGTAYADWAMECAPDDPFNVVDPVHNTISLSTSAADKQNPAIIKMWRDALTISVWTITDDIKVAGVIKTSFYGKPTHGGAAEHYDLDSSTKLPNRIEGTNGPFTKYMLAKDGNRKTEPTDWVIANLNAFPFYMDGSYNPTKWYINGKLYLFMPKAPGLESDIPYTRIKGVFTCSKWRHCMSGNCTQLMKEATD